MSTYGNPAFWRATAERAIKTAAQTAVAVIGSTAAMHQVDWPLTGSIVGLAVVLSLLTSIGSASLTGGPSLGGEHLDYQPERAALED